MLGLVETRYTRFFVRSLSNARTWKLTIRCRKRLARLRKRERGEGERKREEEKNEGRKELFDEILLFNEILWLPLDTDSIRHSRITEKYIRMNRDFISRYRILTCADFLAGEWKREVRRLCETMAIVDWTRIINKTRPDVSHGWIAPLSPLLRGTRAYAHQITNNWWNKFLSE